MPTFVTSSLSTRCLMTCLRDDGAARLQDGRSAALVAGVLPRWVRAEPGVAIRPGAPRSPVGSTCTGPQSVAKVADDRVGQRQEGVLERRPFVRESELVHRASPSG